MSSRAGSTRATHYVNSAAWPRSGPAVLMDNAISMLGISPFPPPPPPLLPPSFERGGGEIRVGMVSYNFEFRLLRW